MARWKVGLLVSVVFILAVFLRTYRITELPPGLYPDEAMNGNNALEALSTSQPIGGFKLYYPENNGREGLFINIQAIVLKFFMSVSGGLTEPWMLRVTSAFFGSLTVLGIYFLGRELFSRRIGFLASLFLATSFWHILFSRIGFRAIMAPFCLVWGMALLLMAIRKATTTSIPTASTAQNTAARWNWTFSAWTISFLGGVVFGLGFHTYIAYRVAPLLLLAAIPFFRTTPNFWKIAGAFVLGAFLAGLPIGLYYLVHPADFLGRTSQVSIFSSPSPLYALGLNVIKTLGMFFVAGDFNPRHNLVGAPELFFPVAVFFLIGTAIVLKGFWREFSRVFLVLTFLLMMLPVVISNEGLPHALRSILLIPPVMLTAALGAQWAYENISAFARPRIPDMYYASFMQALIATAVVVLTAQAAYTYFVLWANHPDTPGAFAANYVDIGRTIRALPMDVPKYVVMYAGGVDVRGIPTPSQTVMFMTDTFTPDEQIQKNVHYIFPDAIGQVPEGASIFEIR
ncbi:MAG: hypothetical protein RL681_576 [Candidatus Parcubacteria bacterium]|jgi:4-amino-4-deoxy-L-arabinose transferase-like glycosyltransferase